MSRKKVVLFDMGGTLIKGYLTAEEFSETISSKKIKRLLGLSEPALLEISEKIKRERKKSQKILKEFSVFQIFQSVLTQNNIKMNNDQFWTLMDKVYAYCARDIELYPNVREVLESLRQRSMNIGLVSNTCFPQTYHIDDLEKLGVLDFFEFTLFSSFFGRRKPHPSIYLHALMLLEREPEEVIFIGDNIEKDVFGPQEVGIRGILIDHHGQHEDYQGERTTSLRDILNFI